MDTKRASHVTAGGIAMAGAVLFASAVASAHLSAGPSAALRLAAETGEPARARVPIPAVDPPKKGESAQPEVKPVPAESRTPEEAAARAADPKDPSGAIIVAPAAGKTKP
jgi:hypothetical protein